MRLLMALTLLPGVFTIRHAPTRPSRQSKHQGVVNGLTKLNAEIGVAARQNQRKAAVFRIDLSGQQRSQGCRAARFDQKLELLRREGDSGFQLGIADGKPWRQKPARNLEYGLARYRRHQ